MTTEDHLRMLRRTGVTAREAMALAGLNSWASLREIYDAKVNDTPLVDELNPDLDMLRAFYRKKTGNRVEPYGIVRHPQRRFAIADPGIAVIGSSTILRPREKSTKYTAEVIAAADKLLRLVSSAKTKAWGQPGSQMVPPVIYNEAQWNMGVTCVDETDVMVRFLGGGQEVYTVKYVPEIFDGYYSIAEHFMTNYAMPATPPPTEVELLAELARIAQEQKEA